MSELHVTALGAHALQRPASALHPGAPHASATGPSPAALHSCAVTPSASHVRNAPASHGHAPSAEQRPSALQVWLPGQSVSASQLTVHVGASDPQPPSPSSSPDAIIPALIQLDT